MAIKDNDPSALLGMPTAVSWDGTLLELRSKQMEVGFVGLGAMGGAMAFNLVKAGHRVRAWDRSGKGSGEVGIVAKPTDAFQAEVVFTMLSDDPAIREVLLDAAVLETARAGTVHVVTSTISVAFASEFAAVHEKAGIGYVSAPVLGRPDAAKEGRLNILAADKRQAVETARPLLEVLAKKVWDMGEEPARANAAKIAANMMITMAIACEVSESMRQMSQAFDRLDVKDARFFTNGDTGTITCRVVTRLRTTGKTLDLLMAQVARVRGDRIAVFQSSYAKVPAYRKTVRSAQ